MKKIKLFIIIILLIPAIFLLISAARHDNQILLVISLAIGVVILTILQREY